MKSIKKRSMNELRQVKNYYRHPDTHKKRQQENSVIRFTKSTLSDFAYELIRKLVFASHEDKLPRLKEDIDRYINENLDD